MNGHKKKYIKDEYEKFFHKISNFENFMLLNFDSDKRSLMIDEDINKRFSDELDNDCCGLAIKLKNSLTLTQENVYYGIPDPVCDFSSFFWYCRNIENDNVTFANVFECVNERQLFNNLKMIKRDAVVITNATNEIGSLCNLNVLKSYSLENESKDYFTERFAKLIDDVISDFGDKNNLLYVVSVGNWTVPLLYALYLNNPNNCYVDFGHSLDFVLNKNRDEKNYERKNNIKSNCFMFEKKDLDFDVSVVLTTYKKPDALERQLSAVESQSLKPKEILLYQDGIKDDYTIKFNSDIIDRFDDVCIASENFGVWKRFEYAKNKCKSKYVCVFDDDAIPGERWLENCFLNMLDNEGVYGTVGIVVKNYRKYPFRGFKRIGWHRPYHKRTKVDFVGHSWFVKKEYLDYMFEDTDKYQIYKNSAEDMCLSFKCKEHGIETFVPPHPYYDCSLWGSQPYWGIKFGQMATAISQNSCGCVNMKKAIKDYVDDGWEFVIKTDKKKTYKNLLGTCVDNNLFNFLKIYSKIRNRLKNEI